MRPGVTSVAARSAHRVERIGTSDGNPPRVANPVAGRGAVGHESPPEAAGVGDGSIGGRVVISIRVEV